MSTSTYICMIHTSRVLSRDRSRPGCSADEIMKEKSGLGATYSRTRKEVVEADCCIYKTFSRNLLVYLCTCVGYVKCVAFFLLMSDHDVLKERAAWSDLNV